MQSQVRYKQRRVHVDGAMTIYTCGELKPRLLEQLIAHPKASELDPKQTAVWAQLAWDRTLRFFGRELG